MTERSAAVYERRGSWFVVAQDRTDAGFSIEASIVTLESADDRSGDGDRLAACVLDALVRSRHGVPAPPPAQIRSGLPEAAGAASWPAFATGAASVHVRADEDLTEIVVTPMRNAGASNGFRFCTDQRATVSPDGLGAALIDAFAVIRSPD